MEHTKLKLNKKNFPNVIAAYGKLAGEVVNEMTRYVKGGSDENNVNNVLNILEDNLKQEKKQRRKTSCFLVN